MPATPLTRLRADGRTLAGPGGVALAVADSYPAYATGPSLPIGLLRYVARDIPDPASPGAAPMPGNEIALWANTGALGTPGNLSSPADKPNKLSGGAQGGQDTVYYIGGGSRQVSAGNVPLTGTQSRTLLAVFELSSSNDQDILGAGIGPGAPASATTGSSLNRAFDLAVCDGGQLSLNLHGYRYSLLPAPLSTTLLVAVTAEAAGSAFSMQHRVDYRDGSGVRQTVTGGSGNLIPASAVDTVEAVFTMGTAQSYGAGFAKTIAELHYFARVLSAAELDSFFTDWQTRYAV